MRKTIVFFLLLLTVGISSCGPEEKTQPITYQGFIDKIWDFKSYPDSIAFKGNTAVIVDFYANRCRPCRQLLPIMEKMAVDYEGELTVYKVDVDQEERLAKAFNVKGLPVYFCFSTNGKFWRYEGLPNEAILREIVEKQLIIKN